MRVMHVITGLDTGGAERMLERLLPALGMESLVVSLREIGVVGEQIRNAGTGVLSLGMGAGRPDPRGALRLIRAIRQFRPDLVQTWMYHADLLGGVCARIAGNTPVVWNIRQSAVLTSELRPGTVATIRLSAAASRWLPQRIVSCSRAGADSHAALGYAREKMVVIPNGFDTERFRPRDEARQHLREELGVPEDTPLIGLVARFDSQKDLPTFLAAADIAARHSDAHFVLCGEGLHGSNEALTEWVSKAGVTARTHLLGRRDDIPRIMAGFDVATSSSIQEGFPNAVGEAMACGVPCVVTDAGDSAYLVGESGAVVPPRDPGALAGAWLDLVRRPREERAAIGMAGRRAIEERFSLAAVAKRYRDLYSYVVTQYASGSQRRRRSGAPAGEGRSA